MPRGGKPVPADAVLQLPADQPLMVGFFRQNGAADEFAIVVNWDYTKPIKCDITAGAKVKGILMANAADGTESAPTSRTARCTFVWNRARPLAPSTDRMK